ncbi:MAG: ATP-dependent helicase [Chloroflexota bacterium]|nr:ATP-dependent helicase [Chloroflexota bacterium]
MVNDESRIPFRPRPKQQEVLNYTAGKMGVSAVPGSGKTYTLSALAAQLVASGVLEDDQEVLVVTLVNSAVDNFASRVGGFVQERGLLPHLGYRVRTLHGLAHDIVRERPALVGLSDDFQIVDERAADQIRQDAAEAWLRSHPGAGGDFLSLALEEGKREWVRRSQWPNLVTGVARSFIRQAKDQQLTPTDLRRRLDQPAGQKPGFSEKNRFLPLAEMGCAIYADYQRGLTYRGAVDFDDLIRLALQALKLDREYLERLRYRWPFILEDEAQDSSQLQEEILRLLVGTGGNWVRVGDPNQAIYETFTTASPHFLRDFLEELDVVPCELPNSGRSTQSIINLANHLIDWTQADHPVDTVRDALTPPHIEPTPPGDPQPNPPDDPSQVRIVGRKFKPGEELEAVADSLARWLPEHQDETVAVLAPRNQRGFALVTELKKRNLEYVELLRSTMATRAAAGALTHIIRYLADPSSPSKLAMVYKVWRRSDREDVDARARLEIVAKAIRKCRLVEDFLWPRADRDWLDGLDLAAEFTDAREQLIEFRELVRRWQGATLLPIDQLLLTLAQDLFQEQADLAVAHKLAVVLRRAGASHPEWRLPELTQELAVIARNERRFLGLSGDDTGFDPQKYKGKVVVATVHKAKGLEWDRVYLMSVNNYDFPSALPHDGFISEKWFIRDRLNLEAEALAQLEALLSEYAVYEEGEATQKARLEYAAERLRLFYVGITRAKRELIITWNTGRQGNQQPAVPFIALQTFWEGLRIGD